MKLCTSSYSMCPCCFVCIIVHAFGYKRRGFAVINIDNISYWVVKNMILHFRPCWAYPVGWSICWAYPVGWSICWAYPVGWSICWVYPVGWSIYGGLVEVERGQEGSIEPNEKLCHIEPCEKLCQSRNYRNGGPR